MSEGSAIKYTGELHLSRSYHNIILGGLTGTGGSYHEITDMKGRERSGNLTNIYENTNKHMVGVIWYNIFWIVSPL